MDPTRVASGPVLWALVSSTLALFLGAAGTARGPGEEPAIEIPIEHSAPAAPGTSTSWWSEALAGIERAEYVPSATGRGFQAPNRAQNFRAQFLPEVIAVEPRRNAGAEAGAWQFTWRTVGFGRTHGKVTSPGASATPELVGSRVVYARDGFREWYENTVAGLEQGFTIDRRPPGEGELVIEGALGHGLDGRNGNDAHRALRPELRDDGAADLIDRRGATVLRYGALKAWDADGRPIPARLAAAGDRLSILIADDAATTRYPVTVDPLFSIPSWAFESNQLFALLGASVATAGDVNGDGYSDVLVGAPQYDNGQDLEGRAFVFYGSPLGPSTIPDWLGESNTMNARFGNAVASAGDVNGDGYSDVLVGAFAFSNGQTSEGRAYLFLGSAGGLASAPAWTVESDQIGGFLGAAVGTAGDVNGDGFSDVIVGASLYDNGQADEGRAFVFHGSAAGLAATPAWIAESDQAAAEFGAAVGTAGDVNGDGFSDVIVGASLYDNGQTSEGRAFVYYGSPSGLAAAPGWTAESDRNAALFGRSVATAGDVNGDGYADVIVGASGYTNGQSSEGAAFLFYGAAAGLEAATGWVKESQVTNAQLGQSVGTAGDVNGDGFADVVIGAPNWTGSLIQVGAAQVYQGSAAGLSMTSSWFQESNQTDSQFGASVGTAGDVNGDGFSDVVVGSYRFDNGQGDEGQALVYLGSADRISSVAAWTSEPNVLGAQFGMSVASAGDVNGDGYDDVIIGAQAFAHGEEEEGGAWVYHGSASGLAIAPAWSAEGNQFEGRFGNSVSAAGDVNGDGYDDVIVGATYYQNGQEREGRAYVYHGSPGGLGVSPAWIAESNQEGAYFGMSVASAGDVNGDGFSDVIVGARVFTNDQANEGRAFVYRGSPGGLSPNPFWTVEADQANAEFGWAVASAGDVNGDGYSDVIVGAPDYQNGEPYEGRAFVYLGAPGTPSSVPVWTGESNEDVSFYGRELGSAGDMDGDGFSDIIVSAPNWDGDLQNEGRIYVHYGTPAGPAPTAGLILEGNQSQCLFGSGVGTAGDVNGDGLSDIIIGASGFDNGQTNEGRVWVYPGTSTKPGGELRSLAAFPLAPAWVGEGNLASAYFGSAVKSAGDVNGDGFSDILIGAPGYSNGEPGEGRVFMYYGNGGDGLDRRPRQARTDDTAPIGILGRSNAESAVRLKALGRTPAGRGRVRLQFEVEPAGIPFDEVGLGTGPWVNTGVPGTAGSAIPLGAIANGLPTGALYHWRLRILSDSPFFPHSRWLWLAQNSVTEADVRTRGAVGVDDPAGAPPAESWVGPSTPNPFTSETTITYTLAHSGRLRLRAFDVHGRAVALLVDRFEREGRHVAHWDGRDDRAELLPAGVYFLRLESGGQSESQKVVRLPF